MKDNNISVKPMKKYTKEELAKFFDHTLLKPEASEEDIRALCEEAAALGTMSVCVNSRFVCLARGALDETDPTIKVAAVAGFPLGAMSTAAKAYEAARAVKDGAEEIDMVIAIGAVRQGDSDYVIEDVRAVRKAIDEAAAEAAGDHRPVLKVILETGLLSDEEIEAACGWAIEGGADYLKTSTGFGHGGAEVRHIEIMKRSIPADREIKIKASGGIRDLETALAMIDAGASRIGASATASILAEL